MHDVEVAGYVRAQRSHHLHVVDVRAYCQDHPVLVLLEHFDELVCVGGVPEHFKILVPSVAEEDVRLREEVLVWVRLESIVDPLDHRSGHLWVLKVLVERVHSVQTEHHRVTTELVRVESSLLPRRLNC